ncbi:MAG: hypothetical protein H0U87_07665 [Acidobacteria bacterium]|nr:hypothetical protein [Acidobacteriota bacterium]
MKKPTKVICRAFLFILVILPVVLLTGGCVSRDTIVSTHVNQSDIYQKYFISGKRESTTVNAFFLVGGDSGTTVELQPPGKAEFNGKIMEKVPPNFAAGTSYRAEQKGYSSLFELSYTDSAGKIYRNRLDLEAVEFAANEPTAFVLHRLQDNFIPVSRTAFDSTENLSLVLSNVDFQKDDTNKININLPQQFDRSKNVLVIKAETVRKMLPGRAILIMETSKSGSFPEQTPTGSGFRATYAAAPLKVQIVN